MCTCIYICTCIYVYIYIYMYVYIYSNQLYANYAIGKDVQVSRPIDR